ncbi:hypothetical protein DFQ28_004562 [Apophysomyces sp. BC1034]|nr:hypothetical protein DFQ29_005181 [Apophysomyces sp. BC1021]KAG0188649.1 hypothetical protein DFQ28_004562 [Apophysomyces sp. BC1034]
MQYRRTPSVRKTRRLVKQRLFALPWYSLVQPSHVASTLDINAAISCGGSLPTRIEKGNNSYLQWVSFTLAIKGEIIHEPNARQDIRPYDRNFANEPARLFIREAPFEAGPEIVYLCDSLGRGVQLAIMSRDGDLFANQGALDVPVTV